MSVSSRPFLMIFGAAVLLLAATVTVLGVAVHRYGMLEIEIQPGYSGAGDHISIRLPGVIVPLAMFFVPDAPLREARREIEKWAPLARDAFRELSSCPDFVMVEVQERDEHVTIAKRGRALVIEVQSEDESVHIVVPLTTVNCVLNRISRGNCALLGIHCALEQETRAETVTRLADPT